MRKPWHNYFMDTAETIASMTTCDRKKVGCVIVKDKRILATGFNGSISNAEHCDDVGHMIEDNHCVRTVHAEVNAIAQCAKYGINCNEASIYINTLPCWNCFKTLINSGIIAIYFRDEYDSYLKNNVFTFCKRLNIELRKIT